MTFPAELERPLKEATEIHAGFSNEITANDTGQKYSVTHLCRSSNGEIVAWVKNGQTGVLIVHLVNHADAILGLVRAAEQMVNGNGSDEVLHEMEKTLAKLNGGKG